MGVTSLPKRGHIEFNEWWVNQGYGADMNYLRTQLPRRKSIESVLSEAKSVVVCALRFPGGDSSLPIEESGKVARYALQSDYHDRLLPMLKSLALHIDSTCQVEGSISYVDTGPLNERALGAQAGLGWIGKNSMLIHPEEGSWFWLGEVITRAKLEPDSPLPDHCGKCRKCIDACPTNAIFEDIRALDSRKCISYWNIEQKAAIPKEIATKMGDWLLGCDICQEVCPWNSHSLKKARKDIGAPPVEWIPLDEILSLDAADFQTRFKGRAHSRAKQKGLERNARAIQKNKSKS